MSHSIPDILSESIDETKKELDMCTKEQLSVVLSSLPEQWITGPAGSGKTWLLMKKVLMLAKNALSEGKKEKILVACHYEPLAKMFGKVFEDELILSFPESGDLEEVVEVKTFDSLLYDITGHSCIFCIYLLSLREEFPIGTHGIGLLKKHVEDLRGQKVNDKDICILTQTESVRDKVSSELKKVGIENQTANQMFQNDDNKVVVESIWRFKGLESKVVVLYCLPFIEQRWFPTLWSLRPLLYTAFSRCLCYMIVISNAVSCKTLKSEKGYCQLPFDVLERREILNDFPKTYRNLSSSSLRVIVGNWTLEPVRFVSQFVILVFVYEDDLRVVEATEECLPTK